MMAICLFRDNARSAQGSARFQRAAFGILLNAPIYAGAEAFRQDAEMDELEARAPQTIRGTRER
jgi:hypothetical protein